MQSKYQNTTPSKKIFIILGILAIGIIVVVALSSNSSSSTSSNGGYELISPTKAASLISEYSEDEEFTVLDIRTASEVNQGVISPNPLIIDYYSPDFSTTLSTLDTSKKYLVYCNSGNRSREAVRIMEDLGFEQVYELQGGIQNWLNNDNQVF